MSVRCGTLASDTDWQSGNVSLEDGERGGAGCIHSISWSQLQAELEFSESCRVQGDRRLAQNLCFMVSQSGGLMLSTVVPRGSGTESQKQPQ